MNKPFFLTVDTEGDNIWSRPQTITSFNTQNLEKFQNLCQDYDIKPIYLVNYEACINADFVDFINGIGNHCEIGLHLHGWNSPPLYDLTGNDNYNQPYLNEYPEKIISKKLTYLIDLLKNTFKSEIISHRGGRYSTSPFIFSELARLGVKIDCSYTPGYSWSSSIGDPSCNGGPDYRNVNSNIHEIITDFGILTEIPVSTFIRNRFMSTLPTQNYIRRFYGKFLGYPIFTLRSDVNNLKSMIEVLNYSYTNTSHIEYIIHSSELSAGFSPLYQSKTDEDKFYYNLKELFEYIRTKSITPLTFKEYNNIK